ncbi:MAG TPA: UvrD-helicase domain-containing protein [Acidisarcina sp.]
MTVQNAPASIDRASFKGTPALRDASARARALDQSTSFLVQAPAGSGKTELLTDRFLKLLSVVEEPEQVLAITFTRAATAEMRDRIIKKLREADRLTGLELVNDKVALAAGAGPPHLYEEPEVAALRKSKERGWNLLDQPQRLRVETIDSLCMSIAHRMPLLARLGGNLHPTENAGPLYDLAAQRTMDALGGANEELNAALKTVLTLRDNKLSDCERLISEMLRQRDQWGHLFFLSGDVDWDEIRQRFEQPFKDEIRRVLGKAEALLTTLPGAGDELISLGKYACGNLDTKNDIQMLATLDAVPPALPEFSSHWECLTRLVLVEKDAWRKRWYEDDGFPSKTDKRTDPKAKGRIEALTAKLARIPEFLETLCEVRKLPPPRYTDEQWGLLLQLFTTLRHAVARLKVVFAERNVVDYAELGLAAEMVLQASGPGGSDSAAEGVEHALAIGDSVKHLLVDEFQDTSRRQHQLLVSILRGWDTCDGRTCFFVGDPMQSIYSFRQAEVELFERVRRHGLECESGTIELETLRLQTNFRSHSGLVGPLNNFFNSVFADASPRGVAFSPSVASEAGPGCRVHVYAGILPKSADIEQKRAARRLETEAVLKIVRNHLPDILRAQSTTDGKFKIGILVRAKRHAASIAAALRDSAINFRAVDLETLRERQEILDLLALIRALAHPMDRVAWLSVLRAPWCGLELRDLHALCGTDLRDQAYTFGTPVLELLRDHFDTVSPDGQERARRTRDVLLAALEPRNRHSASMSFADWVERTWFALGGPGCVDATGLENVQTFFGMLDELEKAGVAHSTTAIDAQLERLFAQPDTSANEHAGIQVMTIHKAKGLGFDVVIVPGLERGQGPDGQSLVCWLQRQCAAEPAAGPRDEVLVAPIGQKGQKQAPLYRWVQEQRNKRDVEERKRVLYVACTRASGELHLLGTATEDKSGLKPGEKSSLLATAWPGLEGAFMRAAAAPGGTFEVDLVPKEATGGLDNLIVFVNRAEAASIDDPAAPIEVAAGAEEQIYSTQSPGMRLRRLPLLHPAAESRENVTVVATNIMTAPVSGEVAAGDGELYSRPEGSIEARALGIAVHALLEKAAGLLVTGTSITELNAMVPIWKNVAAPILRNNGVVGPHRSGAQHSLGSLTARALDAVKSTLDDPKGRWILSPHPMAQSETAWTGFLDGALRTLRVDRIFRAAAEPLVEGDECLWIVDYKTAGRPMQEVEEFLSIERTKYEKQLEMYGRMLRLARGKSLDLRLGLYYPFLQHLEYWAME